MAKTIRKNNNQNNREKKNSEKKTRKPRKIKEEPIFEGELNNKERSKFRQTKRWKLHRLHIKSIQNGLDYVTHKPLRKGYQCHHLSSDRSRYCELSDELQIGVNRQTHDAIHLLFSWKCKNPQAIDRLLEVVNKMYEMNNGRDFD